MQARIARVGEIVVVHLAGRVDVETAEPFRKACNEFLMNQKVVFDFQALSFVGSSGILPFLETMQTFATKSSNRFKFSGVGSEFKKVFAATSLNTVEIYDTHQLAALSFSAPVASQPQPQPQPQPQQTYSHAPQAPVPSTQPNLSPSLAMQATTFGNAAVHAAPQVGQAGTVAAQGGALAPTASAAPGPDARRDFGLLSLSGDEEG